jgi:hypothetical protein
MEKSQTEIASIKLLNLNMTLWAVSIAGGVAGVVYSNKTGGGFWRGVGWYFVGSIAASAVGAIVAYPIRNKIIDESGIETI